MKIITLPRAVVEQALEALEAIREADTAGATPKMVIEARSMYEPTITALRAALAQAEPMTPADRIEAEADRRGRALAAEMRAALAQEQAEQTWVCPDSPEHRYAKPGHCEDCGKTLVMAQEQAERAAYGYASRLAVAIWEQHYKDTAPNWKPLNDLMGVLTQIDNMTAGLTRQEQAEPVYCTYPHCRCPIDKGKVCAKGLPEMPRIDRRRTALTEEQPEPVCKCDLRTRLVGDGCEVCNPALAAELAREQAEPVQELEPVDVRLLEYRGNSVAFIHQKMTAYRTGIDAAWDAFRANGLHPDGKTSLADMIAKHTAPPKLVPLTEEEIDRITDQQWGPRTARGFSMLRSAPTPAPSNAHTESETVMDNTLTLAHQAGIVPGRPVTAAQLAELAALVRADEREACAEAALAADDQGSVNQWLMQKRIASAIRARNHQSPATVADRLARHGIPMPGDDST